VATHEFTAFVGDVALIEAPKWPVERGLLDASDVRASLSQMARIKARQRCHCAEAM
jgi:hypothetical protein